ncbi:MAG: xanthine dehydrogenase family protein molybdopterin-binding subunit, partial [Acidimicrobiales bacterium]|nr:xanthine dehydrogenase family protein molybdopterin-binding subunit [Acidimicrobiales bacterium]
MSILGNEVKRVEDPRFLTGEATFVGDVALRGADPDLPPPAHAVFARSSMAHARVLSIETGDAQAAPGVLGVFTMADLDVALVPTWGPVPPGTERTAMATDKVRFVGEPIAVVVAETAHQAADAAELIWADYDPLPAVTEPLEAAEDGTLLFDEFGTNVVSSRGYDKALDFGGCDVVVTAPIVNNRMSAAPIEPRVALAAWSGDQLTMWSSTQGAHAARDQIATVAKLDAGNIRVIVPDIGGSFGAKGGPAPEECILPLLAKSVGTPVQWVETRTENLQSMGWSRAQWQTVTMGGTADGTITHYQLEVIAEVGAYAEAGVFMPTFTRMMTQGVYDIPNIAFMGKTVLCNTAPLVAFRGAGRPEATAALERAVDLFANEAGLDPVEVRTKNFIRADAFPFTTKVGTVYDCGDYEAALEQALAAADYPTLRAEQRARRERGDVKQLCIGLSCYVEITA